MVLEGNLRYHKVYDLFFLWVKKIEAQRGGNLTKVSLRIRNLVSGFFNILFTPPLTSKFIPYGVSLEYMFSCNG